MGNFFKGWRRKIGVVTLLMALAFAAGWVRSGAIDDGLIRKGPKKRDAFVSINGQLNFFRITPPPGYEQPAMLQLFGDDSFWFSMDLSTIKGFNKHESMRKQSPLFDSYDLKYEWELAGFAYFSGDSKKSRVRQQTQSHLEFYSVPYWFIVIALTTLSAYLILAKPWNSNKTKILEPTANEGA